VSAAALPAAPRRTGRHRKSPARRTALSVDGIVAAAIEVLDEAGVAGLSMRRVAEQIGTGPASLYAHVAGRTELLELVFDELVGRVARPEPDPLRWREQVHEMLNDLRSVLAAHRDAALAGFGYIPTTPRTLAGAEALVALLRAGGLSDRVVALGLDQLLLYVSAAAFEEGLFERDGMGPADIGRYYAEVHAFYAALPPEHYPVLAAIAPEMTGADDDERFRFGIDVLIGGLVAVDAASRR
jgi:AcrR family transcriptional regulator